MVQNYSLQGSKLQFKGFF